MEHILGNAFIGNGNPLEFLEDCDMNLSMFWKIAGRNMLNESKEEERLERFQLGGFTVL